MSSRETWITIKNGNIVRHSENDGYALMRGFQAHDEIIMPVEEARKKGVYKDIIKSCEESPFDWKKQLIRSN